MHHYLKLVSLCTVCCEAHGHFRADDVSSWLTIVLVGHPAMPIVLSDEYNFDFNVWIGFATCISLMVVLHHRWLGMKFRLKTNLGLTAVREIGNYLRAYGTGRHWIEKYGGEIFIHTVHDKDMKIIIENFLNLVDPVDNCAPEQR